MPTQSTETNEQPPLILRLLRNRGFRFIAAYLFISLMLITHYGVSDVFQTFFNFASFFMAAIFYAFITWTLLPCIERKPQRAGATCIFLSLFFLAFFYSNPIIENLASRIWPASNYQRTISQIFRAISFLFIMLAGSSLYKKIFNDSLWAARTERKPKGQ